MRGQSPRHARAATLASPAAAVLVLALYANALRPTLLGACAPDLSLVLAIVLALPCLPIARRLPMLRRRA